jgi:phospholipid/cholesterol/gamma-HCH transport system substrate-binding protein
VAVLILITLLYEMFGGLLLSPKTVIYLYIPDASGLTGDSPVTVDGIDVGRVSSVALSHSKDPNRAVKVELQFYRDRLRGVPADSVAQISSDSLIGDKFVDINGGTSPQVLPYGGELTYKDQPELVRSLDLTQFTQQLRLVDATLKDIEEGRSQFGEFYKGTQFYNDLLRRLTQLQTAIAAAVSTSGELGGLLGTDKLYVQVQGALEQIDRSVAQIQSGPGTAGQMLQSSAAYDNILQQAQQFHKTVDQIGKSDLFQSTALYDNLTQTLGSMIRMVDEFNRNPLMSNASLYQNLDGSMRELRDSLKDFRVNPGKFMRLKVF